MTVKQMSAAQRTVLQELDGYPGFPGYCELMAVTGLTSYKAVDWVLNALLRRGYIAPNNDATYTITDTGRTALRG